MSTTITILNGPNLNLLGEREPEIYGKETLADIEARCKALAEAAGFGLTCAQSNHEGELVDWIQAARKNSAGLIINAGAFTHTSVAIHDALKSFEPPIIELHISNPHAREAFRHQSYIAPAATAIICGFGTIGYDYAATGMIDLIKGRGE